MLAGFAATRRPDAPPRPAPTPCAETLSAPSRDLYCIDLLPAAGVTATGTAELRPADSPFGVRVTPAGSHVYDVGIDVSGLPDPATLGPYTTYIAWVFPPRLDPVVRLGALVDGHLDARIDLDQFLIVVTAESRPDARTREGRLVVRGISASMRLQPHDMPFFMAGAPDAAMDHAAHGWSMPPMNPDIQMPPALMRLRPDVGPLMPSSAGAPVAKPRSLVRLSDGDTMALTAQPVRKRLGTRTVTMLGFNGEIPGPLVQVDRGTTVTIRFRNETTLPTTVHWHGLRLDNRFDGVPHVTQDPVPPGGTFDYTVHFPDAGLYWYHPHMREDVLQDLGLYGNLFVRPDDPAWLAPVNREEFLLLDDLLVGEDGPVAYGDSAATHALMGRFGNVLLVNGEPRWEATANAGEVVRLWLTNVSSTRVFNLSFDGPVTMKVVASDLGRFEREERVDNVVIAPAERYAVDVRFDRAGTATLLNRVRAIDHLWGRYFDAVDTLATVRVSGPAATPDHRIAFEELRENDDVVTDVERYRPHFEREPDHTLVLSLQPGDLPFPLLPLLSMEAVYRNPVEWEGTMPMMDWVGTATRARWVLRDPATGLENMDIDWRFRVGDIARIRILNDRDGVHAMQHPIHLHGQRFLVTAVNGVPETNHVWKDTVLVPAGFAVDILLELTNPGAWMLHCHIAEHIEAGMHMVFRVEG